MLLFATMVLSLVGAVAVDWLSHRAGLTPPGFLVPEGEEERAWLPMLRRSLAIMLLAAVFWVGVFGALATLGQSLPQDFSGVGTGVLFLLHLIFAVALVIWYLLGFAGFDAIQLLIVVPLALEFIERGGEAAPWLPVAGSWWGFC